MEEKKIRRFREGRVCEGCGHKFLFVSIGGRVPKMPTPYFFWTKSVDRHMEECKVVQMLGGVA